MNRLAGTQTTAWPTWWLIPRIVSGLVHPSYKWINPTYPIYNWGYNPLTKWDEPPSSLGILNPIPKSEIRRKGKGWKGKKLLSTLIPNPETHGSGAENHVNFNARRSSCSEQTQGLRPLGSLLTCIDHRAVDDHIGATLLCFHLCQ